MAFYIHVDLRYRDIFETQNLVDHRFMYSHDCFKNQDGAAEVCPYGNSHTYGLDRNT